MPVYVLDIDLTERFFLLIDGKQHQCTHTVTIGNHSVVLDGILALPKLDHSCVKKSIDKCKAMIASKLNINIKLIKNSPRLDTFLLPKKLKEPIINFICNNDDYINKGDVRPKYKSSDMALDWMKIIQNQKEKTTRKYGDFFKRMYCRLAHGKHYIDINHVDITEKKCSKCDRCVKFIKTIKE